MTKVGRLFISFTFFIVCSCNMKLNHDLLFYHSTPAFTADPLEFDLVSNHIIYKSVFSTLTNNYSSNGIKGVIAKGWTSSNSNKTWEFEIQDNLFFNNKDSIDAESVATSFKRLIYKLNSLKSKDGILEYLVGFNDSKSPTDKVKGISVHGNILRMEFIKPMPNLANDLSFGLYSVVNKNDFDQNSGDWISGLHGISSNQYEIIKANESEMVLKLRKDFGFEYGHNKKFDKIRISFNKNDINNSDMMLGTSFLKLPSEKFKYSGGLNYGILFFRSISWTAKNSSLNSLENRIAIREALYEELEKLGVKITRSFFPLGLQGVEEASKSKFLKNKKIGQVKYRNYGNLLYKNRDNLKLAFHKLNDENLRVEEVEVSSNVINKELAPNLNSYSFDILTMSTGVQLEKPHEDIRFMVRSDRGIRLPDLDGSLGEIVSKDFQVEDVNKKIWEQALVWPITHFSKGYIHKKHVDISNITLLYPPVDFNWIGEK